MFCKNCGREIKGQSGFCSFCGRAVIAPGKKAECKKDYYNFLFWVIWLLLLAADLLLLIDRFTWVRFGLLVLIQLSVYLFRKKLFKKVLTSFSTFVVVLLISFLAVALAPDTNAARGDEAFKHYEDYRQELEASEQVLKSFAEAASRTDAKAAVNLFEDSEKAYYADLFAKDPEKIQLIAVALEKAEMVQLSGPESEAAGYPRYAEFEVKYDGLIFHVRMVKINGQWRIEKI